jgi:hypothetical protein
LKIRENHRVAVLRRSFFSALQTRSNSAVYKIVAAKLFAPMLAAANFSTFARLFPILSTASIQTFSTVCCFP